MKRVTRDEAITWQQLMRSAFVEGITDADMRDVVKALVERAKSGDMQAIRMVLSYAVGNPGGEPGGIEAMPAPCPPARSLPGEPAKLETFAERVAKGQPLFHPKDRARDAG